METVNLSLRLVQFLDCCGFFLSLESEKENGREKLPAVF
jgi:hypothetical protein